MTNKVYCAHPEGRREGHNNGLVNYWWSCGLCGGEWEDGKHPPKVLLQTIEVE